MCASCGDSGAGKCLEAPEPMAEVVSSAFLTRIDGFNVGHQGVGRNVGMVLKMC